VQLPRTPVKFHYIFNLRDFSRIYEGLLRSTPDKFGSKEQFLRLWRNESTRVFCDRLINPEDKDLIEKKMIGSIVKEFFSGLDDAILREHLIIGDYMTSNPADPDAVDP